MDRLKTYSPLLGLAAFAALGFAWLMSEFAPPPYKMAHMHDLPAVLQTADKRTQEAYQFATANPHKLEQYPCTCGCKYLGHMNNADCYIKLLAPDGSVSVWDEHANGCAVCVDITQDVMRMMREGHKPIDIRAYIDSYYGRYGPSTDTPMPAV